jgi:hypothetical protein
MKPIQSPPIESAFGALVETELKALDVLQRVEGFFFAANLHGKAPSYSSQLNLCIKQKSQYGELAVDDGEYCIGTLDSLVPRNEPRSWAISLPYYGLGTTIFGAGYTDAQIDGSGHVIPLFQGEVDGFCIYASGVHDGAPYNEANRFHFDAFNGAVISLFLKKTKGKITKHTINADDSSLLDPAFSVQAVNLTVDGRVDYTCDLHQAIIFWIGEHDLPEEPFDPNDEEYRLYVAKN